MMDQRFTIHITIMLILLGAPAVSVAQIDFDDSNAPGILTSTSTSTSTTFAASAGLMLTIISMTPKKRPSRQIAAYLNRNRNQFEQDLALGAGSSLEEISPFFFVAKQDTEHFTRLMRHARKDIKSILDDKTHVSVTQADMLIALVHRRMLEHPSLVSSAHKLTHMTE